MLIQFDKSSPSLKRLLSEELIFFQDIFDSRDFHFYFQLDLKARLLEMEYLCGNLVDIYYQYLIIVGNKGYLYLATFSG